MDNPVGFPYFEERLPFGQEVIETSSVTGVVSFLDFIRGTRAVTGYGTIGVICGKAGLGKTMAVRHYLGTRLPPEYATHPTAVGVRMHHRSTAKALARNLLMSLGIQHRGHNVYEVTDEAADAVLRNELDLIVIDEADRLNVDSFEMLRHVFDATGCPIVLVGLPRILSVIRRHEKFRSRVGMYMEFEPLERKEVFDIVLPQLRMPAWVYDPEDKNDRELAQLLWDRSAPSLRKLRTLLQLASQLATWSKAERITVEHISQAAIMSSLPGPQLRKPDGTALNEEKASAQKDEDVEDEDVEDEDVEDEDGDGTEVAPSARRQ